MIRKKFLQLFILLLCGIQVKGANDNYTFGGRAAGMGNSGVAVYDFWGLSHNQASIARLENMAAGVYFENRFLIPELNFGAGALAYPLQNGVLGFSFTYFGFELYNEAKVGLAYARSFGDRFSAGIQLNYHNMFIGDTYGNKGNLTAELGAVFNILPELAIGIHMFNPTRAQIADFANERIPTILKTGLAYTFSERVIVTGEVEHSTNYKPILKAGLEYRITDMLFLRGGIGSQPTTNSFGFGMMLGNLSIDLATQFHYVLGYSPQISMVYHFK